MQKNKKIAFIVPPTGKYRRDERCQSEIESQTAVIFLPPIDLAVYANILRNKGFITKIFDFAVEKINISQSLDILRKFEPNICFIPITVPTEKEDIEYIKKIKQLINCQIWVKGGRAFFQPELLLSQNEIDLVFTAEVEEPLLKLNENLELDEHIPNIAYRKGKKVIKTPIYREEDLSKYPLPARDLIKNELYLNPLTLNPMTVINAHRGCPSNCIFCPAPIIEGKKVRFRTTDDIIEEIKECVFKYKIYEFLFNGDTFTINKKWIIELCKKIISENLSIKWACNSRVDTLDSEMATYMKKAGCWIIGFGIESGDEYMLEKMKKNISINKIKKTISMCKKIGIKTHTFYIIGLPWETEETLKNTLKLAKELDADFFDFNIAYPIIGTPFYEYAVKNNLLVIDDMSLGGYSNAIIRSFKLTNQELNKWRKKMLFSLYLRPGYILRTVTFLLKQKKISYHLKYILNRFRKLLK